MAEILSLALKGSIVLLIFAIGLGSTHSDLMYLWRRPAELARALLAMYVVVPLAALALVRLLPLPAGVETTILVLAISAGAPLLPKKLVKLGREGYVFSLVVISSLVAIIAVPVWLMVLAPYFERATFTPPGAIAALIAKAFLAPLVAGMLLRLLIKKHADQLSDWILSAAGIVLSLAGITLLVLGSSLLIKLGWVPLVALMGLTVVSLACGHVLGGPDPQDRTALAVSCATRHIGIALMAASATPGPETVAMVLAYLVASALVSIPYITWRGKATRREAAA